MIREALHPYPEELVIATKGGFVRPYPSTAHWIPLGRPEYLVHAAKLSARRLGVDTIDLWQLHRIDPKVPRDEQFGAIAQLIAEGVIRRAGLSEVSVDEIKAAQACFPVVSVQNKYSISDRNSEAVLSYCEANHIAFIPWRPIDGGNTAATNPTFQTLLTKYKATPGQLALAWMLKRSPVMLPIPGTSKVAHLEENAAAAAIELSDDDFATLNALR
jgi:aryl-alcohol dehydrogenase-like predicted oxidoreductase